LIFLPRLRGFASMSPNAERAIAGGPSIYAADGARGPEFFRVQYPLHACGRRAVARFYRQWCPLLAILWGCPPRTVQLNDPVIQTCLVGFVLSLTAGCVSIYLWKEHPTERFLLFWGLAWLVGTARWAVHYPAVVSSLRPASCRAAKRQSAMDGLMPCDVASSTAGGSRVRRELRRTASTRRSTVCPRCRSAFPPPAGMSARRGKQYLQEQPHAVRSELGRWQNLP